MESATVPPSRDELERLSLPDLLSVAQQLGVDVSYVKERSEVIKALADQRRHQLARYSEELQKFKIRLESQAQELELAKQHFQSTYDRVEEAVSEKFQQLRDQVNQKELDVKSHLLFLKNKGDTIIEDSADAMQRELDMLGDTIMRCHTRSLDVLDITPSTTSISVTIPTLAGRCFDFHDITSIDLAPLRITLDLEPGTKQLTMDPPQLTRPQRPQPSQPALSGSYQPPSAMHSYPSQMQHSVPQQQYSHYDGYKQGGGMGAGGRGASGGMGASGMGASGMGGGMGYSQPPPAGPPPMPVHSSRPGGSGTDMLTFTEDPSLEILRTPAGLSIKLADDAENEIMGTKAKEVFSNGLHMWRLRCDNITTAVMGLVDALDRSDTIDGGFFWSPTSRDTHGKMGKPSPSLRNIPLVRNGDVIKMIYDADAGILRVAINGIDHGPLCTDLFGHMSPCFILTRGNALTLLQ